MNTLIKNTDTIFTLLIFGIKIAVFVYLLLIAGLYILQRRMIFPGAYSGKVYENTLGFEKIPLTAEDGVKIFAYKYSKKHNDKAIFLFHGNDDTAGRLLESAVNNGYATLGFDLYAVEYRGYDTIKPYKTTEETINLDVVAILPLLTKYKTVIFKGHSLGCFSVTSLLNRYIPDAAILEAPFFDMTTEANSRFPIIPLFLVKLILKDSLDNHEKLQKVMLKRLLIVHSENDQTIPFRFGKMLSETAHADNNRFIAIKDSTHNDIVDNDKEIITNYLKNL